MKAYVLVLMSFADMSVGMLGTSSSRGFPESLKIECGIIQRVVNCLSELEKKFPNKSSTSSSSRAVTSFGDRKGGEALFNSAYETADFNEIEKEKNRAETIDVSLAKKIDNFLYECSPTYGNEFDSVVFERAKNELLVEMFNLKDRKT